MLQHLEPAWIDAFEAVLSRCGLQRGDTVAVLAESHISVHTWPERGYAAFDVFMCGSAEPRKAVAVLEKAFAPKRVVIGHHKRGVV